MLFDGFHKRFAARSNQGCFSGGVLSSDTVQALVCMLEFPMPQNYSPKMGKKADEGTKE